MPFCQVDPANKSLAQMAADLPAVVKSLICQSESWFLEPFLIRWQ